MNLHSTRTNDTHDVRTRRTYSRDGQVAVYHCTSSLAPGSVDSRTPVSAAMTTNVACVSPDLGIRALRALFVEQGISGAPVVNERGLPIGIVSKSDLVRYEYEQGGTREQAQASSGALGDLRVEDADEPTVGDLMLPIAFTLLESDPLAHAATLMAWEGVHRLPICSDVGAVVGIVSALDIVRWMARQEGYPVRRGGAFAGPAF